MESAIPTVEPLPEPSSFLTRAANVFSAPTDLYDEVSKMPPQNASWLIPLFLALILGVVASIAIFSNPDLKSQIKAQQQEEMQKKISEGQMTQEQADKAGQFMDSSFVVIISSAAIAIFIAGGFFVIPLVLWLAARSALGFQGRYLKMLELFGLASIIGAFGTIVTLLLMNYFGVLAATPSGSLFIMHAYDRHSTVHNLLAELNIFTLWQVAVIGLGLAKVSGKPIGQGIGLTFGLWAVWAIFAAFMGWGLR